CLLERLEVLHGEAERGRDLGGLRRLPELLSEPLLRPPHLAQLCLDVDRKAYEPGLVGEGALDRLSDPPRGVGGEARAAVPAELLDRPDESEIALRDQVAQRQATVLVPASEHHHQAEVRLHHATLRRFASLGDLLRERYFLLAREEGDLADLA